MQQGQLVIGVGHGDRGFTLGFVDDHHRGVRHHAVGQCDARATARQGQRTEVQTCEASKDERAGEKGQGSHGYKYLRSSTMEPSIGTSWSRVK